MTRAKRVVLTVCIAGAAMLAIVIWSECRATAILSEVATDHVHRISREESDSVVRIYDDAVAAMRSSLATTTRYAVAITLLSFASVVLLWLPQQVSGLEEPNQAPEPTTTAVTSPAAQEPRQR